MDNLTGIYQISESLDDDKPFLFCIGENNKSNFELLQYSLVLSRIYSNLDQTARFSLDDFPIDFLSFVFDSDDDFNNSSSEIAEKVVYPFLIKLRYCLNSLNQKAS